jgi:hypothetical protein
LFALGSLLKITEIAHILGLLFPRLGFCKNLAKNGLCYILGDFFANSFGHHDGELLGGIAIFINLDRLLKIIILKVVENSY